MIKRLISPAILSLAGILSLTTPASSQNTSTMEKQQITQTITHIFAGTDARNWDRVSAAMAAQVRLDYTSLAGGEPVTLSPEQITSAWAQVLPGFSSTHHQIGNFDISIDGNTASAHFHGLALHYLPHPEGDYWLAGGTYDLTLSKTSGHWLVEGMTFNLREQSGNLNLPAAAAESLKNGKTPATRAASAEASKAVDKFFARLEGMDIPGFLKVWADGGQQIMPLSPKGFPTQLDGKEAIHNQYKGLPENFASMRFPHEIFPTADPNTVIVKYTGEIALKAGGRYDNIYIGVFETRDGQVTQFTEYFDPEILATAFGIKLQDNFNVQKASTRKVSFNSEGLVLKGTLHLPAAFDESKQYTGVVVTGSWTTVKEQMPDGYAARLAEQGYVALSFDFRNYGESEGQPRNYEDPALKAADIVNASRYLQGLPFVADEKVGGLAICASAGYMAQALTEGAPIQAATFVAPWLHNGEIVKLIYGGKEGVEAKITKAEEAKARFAKTGTADYVPAISTSNPEAAMYGDFDYYLNAERGAIPAWGNQFAVMAWKGWLTFDPLSMAPRISTPINIVHSQAAAVPMGTEQFYQNLSGDKNITWLDNVQQFDFYDQEPYTSDAVTSAARWFSQHLD